MVEPLGNDDGLGPGDSGPPVTELHENLKSIGYGIEVGGNATLANELKAPAGALLLAGLLMFAGVIRLRYAVVSLATAAAVYSSYGLGRVISIAVDGLPHIGMIIAAGIEIAIGAVCLLTLLQVRGSEAI